MSTLKLSALLLLLSVSNSLPAIASTYSTVNFGGPLGVSEGETEVLSVPGGARHIKNIYIQAYGRGCDSTVDVLVNGEIKGTVYAPGRDPAYTVTIEAVASSISFQHRSGCSMVVQNVKGNVSSWKGHARSGGSYAGSSDQLEGLASDIIRTIDALRAYATPENDAAFLLPIKKAAANVLVMATTRGGISRKTAQALEGLIMQIDYACEYLNTIMSTDAQFDLAVELKGQREQIDELLN